jgi:uncharacterized membrane protein YbhN (UPF0104 family)
MKTLAWTGRILLGVVVIVYVVLFYGLSLIPPQRIQLLPVWAQAVLFVCTIIGVLLEIVGDIWWFRERRRPFKRNPN